MRYFIIVLVLAGGVLFLAYLAPNKQTANYQVAFIDYDGERGIWTSDEIDERMATINDVLDRIPMHMHNIMTANGEVPIIIYVDPHTNSKIEDAISQSGGGVGGGIILFAPVFDRLAGGEQAFIVVREIGKIYQNADTTLGAVAFLDVLLAGRAGGALEYPPMPYGEVYDPKKDYAESFALYVVWPEALKECCPIRYSFMRSVFGREYEAFPGIEETRVRDGLFSKKNVYPVY